MPKHLPSLAAAALLVFAAPSAAAVPHTVQPGETLWGIALQSNLTTRALAVYNGLPEDGYAIAGTTLQVPTVPEAAAALAEAAAPAPATTEGSAAAGAHVVQWGETLSEIAARAGTSTQSLAAANGLDQGAVLLAGKTLTLPAPAVEATPSAPAADPAGNAEGVERAGAATTSDERHPIPAPGKVSSQEISAIAAGHEVDPALASAVAWNESGFENGLVSTADARGVMQILPSTWDWIDANLSSAPLDPASPLENVHAGVMYLRHLLGQTAGDEATAAAGYYQGLASVQRDGLFDDTRVYVDNVLALKDRFGR